MAVQLSPTQRGVVAGVVSAALLIGAFTIGAAQTSASPSAGGTVRTVATPAAGTRITVTGTGNVSGAPNQLVLSMGVQTSGASVAGALRQANQAVRAITAVLTRSGVRAASIQTSGLSIQPNYDNSGAPSGYGVSEQLSITLNRLSSAGTQISQAVRAGGNATVIDGVSLNLSDTGSLLAAARAKAVADAKAKAAAYARALGRPLGPVVSMSEGQSAPPPVYPVPFANGARAASSVPVHPGTQQLSVTVTVVFALG
jgi:uncharacterized protein YggE